VANEGLLPKSAASDKKTISPRRRGVMQGLFFFLLSFLVVPLIAMITIASNSEPFAVFTAVVIFTMGGLLRAAYALMFEPAESNTERLSPGETTTPQQLSSSGTAGVLEGSSSVPTSAYKAPSTGKWRDTKDLVDEPGSVTDTTTQLLEKDQ
jgi:hypothetical protein